MHKREVWTITALLLLAVFASAQKIVVTFPAYDIVLKEAFPNADVILLTKGVTDPHMYQLTPQDLQMIKALTERDVIISSMHAPFELRIAEMVKNGEIKAKLIDLTKIQWYLTWDGELVKGAEHDHEEHDHGKHDHGAHKHDHDAHKHDHGGLNLHDHGVFPPNVFILIEEVSKATGLKPDQNFIQKLKQLNATYANKFSGKAIAINPAAQYLLYWLGFRDIALFIKEPGVPPSPADLQKALQYAKEGAPALAVALRGEALRIVHSFRDKMNEHGAQPKIITADFSENYLSTLENLAKEIAGTAKPTETAQQTAAQQPSTAQQTQPVAQTPNVSSSVDAAVWVVLVAVVVIAAAIVAIALRRKPKR
ncbi:MAG: metal ABC transporter solute-binding protein, Zn/Mn family [Pyrobaculum sp.]|jgi:zinc/manganese transport system substrate-binding protein